MQPRLKPNPKGPFWTESSLDLDDAPASFCDACSSVEELVLFLSLPSSPSSSQKRRGDRPSCRGNTNAELSCTLAPVATFLQLSCSATNAHLGVKLQPLTGDGGDGDLLPTLSHSPYNLLMPQRLYRLSVDLQQQISVLQARALCRTAALQLTQDVDCYSHGR